MKPHNAKPNLDNKVHDNPETQKYSNLAVELSVVNFPAIIRTAHRFYKKQMILKRYLNEQT